MQTNSVSRLKALAVSDPLESSNRTTAAFSARFRLCLQLSDDGMEMKRQALRRQDPSLDEGRVEQELRNWLVASLPTGDQVYDLNTL